MPDLSKALAALKAKVGSRLRKYHRARSPSESGCRFSIISGFSVLTALLAGSQWMHTRTSYWQKTRVAVGLSVGTATTWRDADMASSGSAVPVARRRLPSGGNVSYGRLRCPNCDALEALIAIARKNGQPPRWHLFAQELIPVDLSRPVSVAERLLVTAGDNARRAYERAGAGWMRYWMRDISIPDAPISDIARDDDRVTAYGYRAWTDLFNARQLLHLGLLHRAIMELDKEIYGIATTGGRWSVASGLRRMGQRQDFDTELRGEPCR